MGELGPRFRLARENKQVSLQQAGRDTRIRLKYLQALEDQDMASLPPEVYVKGFVRNYASYLGLDPNEMLALYRAALGQAPVAPPQPQADQSTPATVVPAKPAPAAASSSIPTVRRPTSPLESRAWLSPNLIIGLAVIVVVVLAAWFLLTSSVYQDLIRPTTPSASVIWPTQTSLVTAISNVPPTAAATLAPGVSPAPASPTAAFAPGVEVEVRALPDSYGCWLEVYVDGQEAFRGMLQPGASRTWTGQDRIGVHIGNAGGVEATVNGKPQGLLGTPGQVIDIEWTRPGLAPTPTPIPSAPADGAPSKTPTITPTPTVPVVTSTPTPTSPPTPTGTPFPTAAASPTP